MTPSSSEVEAFKARTERDKAQALLLQSQTSTVELDRRAREREDIMQQITILDRLMENKSCTPEMMQQFEVNKRELMMKFF
jgi:hypothetical protein